jgi:type I restriction enzyme R subunit/putative DNA methylase
MDHLLGEGRSGPLYLLQPPLAQMITESIRYGSDVLKQYELHAFVVMPNHVHVLLTPAAELPRIMQSLKSVTARRANAILGIKGERFWQRETYDHLVRDSAEFERIRRYIEWNPVSAGLASDPNAYRWSSAYETAGRSQAITVE